MTGWLIYDQKQYDKNKWFADEISKYCSAFCDMELIIVENLKFGIKNGSICFSDRDTVKKKPDFAICRTIFPLLTFTMECNGIRVFNSYTVSKLCNDKCYTYAMAAKANVPIMDTLFCDRRFFDDSLVSDKWFPFIAKSVDGHGGSEVFRISNREEFESVEKDLKKNFLIQHICNTLGQDLRVYVLGGRILAGVLRKSDNFKSNYSLGGTAEVYSLNDSEKRMINDIIALFPTVPDFVGIDFLYDNGRLIFNEIEDVVGTRMLYKFCDINAAELFADYIKNIING